MTSPTNYRRLIFIAIAVLLLLLSFKYFGYYYKENKGLIGTFGRLLNQTNNFKVCYFNIDTAEVNIVWHSEYGLIDTLVKAGIIKENTNYEYGKEKFTIFYRDTFLVSDGFFSINNNEVHDVQIGINKTDEGFLVQYIIDQDTWTFHIDNQRMILRRE